MTTIERRLVQLCALLAATIAIGRTPWPVKAEACATCVTADKCDMTPRGGTTGCMIESGSDCKQYGDPCGS